MSHLVATDATGIEYAERAARVGPVALCGSLSLHVDSEATPIRLKPGDCYLLTNGRPYRTYNAPDVEETDGAAFFASARDGDALVRLGASPSDKVVIGGRFIFDPEAIGWFRKALPATIHIRADAPQDEPLRQSS